MRSTATGVLLRALLVVWSLPAGAAETVAPPLEFHATRHESGEAWLFVRNGGDSSLRLREFRWSDSPRTSTLDLQLEPHQQSSVSLPIGGKPPLWVLVEGQGWIGETGQRDGALAAAPAVAAPTPSSITAGWTLVLNSFNSMERAQADAEALRGLGYRAEVVGAVEPGLSRYRVLVRGYASDSAAREASTELSRKHGRKGWVLRE